MPLCRSTKGRIIEIQVVNLSLLEPDWIRKEVCHETITQLYVSVAHWLLHATTYLDGSG